MSFSLPSKNSLNITQKYILNVFEQQKDIVVLGGPGTGKSILVVHAIKDALEKGKKCLFLCYNNMLLDFMSKYTAAKCDDFVLIKTWLSWLPSFCRQLFGTFNIYQFQYARFRYDFPKLLKAINEHDIPEELKFDCVFVDEAQDLPLPLFEIIRLVGRQVFIALDNCQALNSQSLEHKAGSNERKRSFDLEDMLSILKLDDCYYDLVSNYRNTKQIERVAKYFSENGKKACFSLPKSTSDADGVLPALYHCDGDSGTSALLQAIKDYYQEGLRTIAILVPKFGTSKERALYMDCFLQTVQKLNYKIGNSSGTGPIDLHYKYGRTTNINADSILKDGLYFLTFQTCKGLEFDEVLIPESDRCPYSTKADKNALYVAITRAGKRLGFFYSNPKGKLIRFAKKDPQFFENIDFNINENLKEVRERWANIL